MSVLESFLIWWWIFWGAITIISIVGWINHVIICIQTEAWLFLIAGAIAFPIGVIHGVGNWFGAWS